MPRRGFAAQVSIMDYKSEILPGEVGHSENGGRTVHLTLTSTHIVARQVDPRMSIFRDAPRVSAEEEMDGDYSDEELPEGFSPEAIADFDADWGDDDADTDFYGEDVPDGEDFDEDEKSGASIDEIYAKLSELAEELSAEKNNTFVFETTAEMRHSTGIDGGEVIEISYAEDSSMDGTRTTIVYAPSQNGRVSIIHSGSVMSSLICERGVRHISAYETPIAPLEVAVYARECKSDLTYADGGTIDLDYLVELRGMDVQRTKMKIQIQ